MLAIHGRQGGADRHRPGPASLVVGTPARRTGADVAADGYYHALMDAGQSLCAELAVPRFVGDIPLEIATRPLADIGAAWDAPTTGDRRRQVLVPGASRIFTARECPPCG